MATMREQIEERLAAMDAEMSGLVAAHDRLIRQLAIEMGGGVRDARRYWRHKQRLDAAEVAAAPESKVVGK